MIIDYDITKLDTGSFTKATKLGMKATFQLNYFLSDKNGKNMPIPGGHIIISYHNT